MENRFCQECGSDLNTATFAIPRPLAEQWAAAFDKFEWPRVLKSDSPAHRPLRKVNPALDLAKETILCIDSIGGEAWFTQAYVNEHQISHRKERVGATLATSSRLILLDYPSNYAWSFFYSDLERATISNDGAGATPVFEIRFGSKGTVRLTRRKMAQLTSKPMGTLSRLFTKPHITVMSDILYMREAASVKDSLERQQAENRLYTGWFNFVIESRQKF